MLLKSRHPRTRIALAVTAALATSAAPPSGAQTIQEIMVTAQKRAQPLAESPRLFRRHVGN
jgi:outer membrane receptor protein involved in Fe transport